MQEGLAHLLRLSSAAAQAHQAAAAAAYGGSPGGSGGVGGGLIADFLIGSTSVWQQRHVRAYAASQLRGGAGRRTLLLLSLCFWEEHSVWPA